MTLVAGVDSSTQSCKVVIRDAESGGLVRSGRAPHPAGTEIHPDRWLEALAAAAADAGGLEDVAAIGVAAQQHGLIALDEDGAVIRPALLWNDTRSATAAGDLVLERSAQFWADEVGVVPVASITVSKLRWLAEAEPENARRTAAVCLPHDWLVWKLSGSDDLDDLRTDRADASGTGYWSARSGSYRHDLLIDALGHPAVVPVVLGPADTAASTGHGRTSRRGLPEIPVPPGVLVSAGTGDNAAGALGLGAEPGDVIISIGTSGVASAVSTYASSDPTGTVAGFADATGHFLPLVCTLNAARVLDLTAELLRVSHEELSDLALAAPSGADGLVLLPYFEGERTPNLPDASGVADGLTLSTTTPRHLARAAVEGLLCGLADGVDALERHGVEVNRFLLIGGGASSEAVRQIAPAVLGASVHVPEPGEYVADGAALQAAWALLGSAEPPHWDNGAPTVHTADPQPRVRSRYGEVRDRYASYQAERDHR